MKRLAQISAVCGLALLAVAAAGVLGEMMDGTASQATQGTVAAPAASQPTRAGATGSDALVARLEARVSELPGDWVAWADLARARVELARTGGDAAQYELAEVAVERSLELRPDVNLPGLLARSTLAAARHDFTAALEASREAVAVSPGSAEAHGAAADALVELGRYDQAADALQLALDRRPGVANLARASYLFELRGETSHAVTTMQRAATLARSPGDRAFTSFHLGQLAFDRGALDEAAEHFEAARHADPSWVAPVAGLARVAAGRGDLDAAVVGYERVVEVLPLPEHVAGAIDVAMAAGDDDAVERYAELLAAQRRLAEAAGVNVDLEIALAEADLGLRPELAVAAAQAEWDRRQSVHVADALAWALHAAGRDAEALPYAREALRLGTRSAHFHFHLGVIEAAVGDDAAARASLERALAINPSFSPRWAPEAQRLLTELGARAATS